MKNKTINKLKFLIFPYILFFANSMINNTGIIKSLIYATIDIMIVTIAFILIKKQRVKNKNI